MDAIPYVDSLVKEYLLFRGFTSSLRAFNRDVSTDRGRGFQADQLCELVFHKLLTQNQATELMEVLEFLSARVYSRLPGSFEPLIRKLEVSILRAHLVLAIQAGKPEVVKDFFTQHAELLLQQPEASDWLAWFALPYISNPSQDERFKVFFTKDWMGLVETSFRNLVSQGIQHLPLPGLLHFNTDRLERQALRKQVEELQSSNTQLKQQLTCSQANPPATAHEEAQSGTQAQLQQAHRQPPSTQHSRSAQAQPSVHSKLVQARTKASKPSGAAPSPPKPISTSSRAQVLPAAATTHFPQSEGVDRPHADGAASSTQHPAAASETQAASHQADEAASLISEPQCSIGTAAARVDVNGSQGSQQTAMQGVSISGSLSDTRASNGTPSLLATTAANTGWQGSRHPLRQTSADQLSSSPRRANDMPAESSHATDQARPRSDLIANGSAGNAESSLQVAVEEQLEGHDHGITCCSFSPNGQNLATASSDGVVRIWAPESLESNASRTAVLLCGAPVSAVAWDNRADKIMLVGTKGKGIKAWHLDTKSMISHIQPDSSCPHVLDVACSPTDPSFVSAASSAAVATAASDTDCGGTLTMWNMRAFRKLRSLDLPGNSVAGSVSFSPDGQTLAAGVSDGSVRIYDVHSNKSAHVAVWELQTHNCRAASVHYCASGAAVVSLTQSGLLQRWDLRRLSSKRLGQPQWSVDLSSYCTQATASQTFAIACSKRAVAMNTESSVVPVVPFDDAAEPVVHPVTVLAGRVANSDICVSAVGWHPSASVLCCGLNQGHVCLQHLKL